VLALVLRGQLREIPSKIVDFVPDPLEDMPISDADTSAMEGIEMDIIERE